MKITQQFIKRSFLAGFLLNLFLLHGCSGVTPTDCKDVNDPLYNSVGCVTERSQQSGSGGSGEG